MSGLSLEQINDILADATTRGGYLEAVKDFFTSGELAVDFTEKYPKKESASLRNSIKQNIDKVENHPKCQIVLVKNGDSSHVILINLDVYALQS